MPLSDAMNGKSGAKQNPGTQDPGPKKQALTWDQMRLWNKYVDKNEGKPLDQIFNMMAKENPNAVKGLNFESLKGAIDEQSLRDFDRRNQEYDKKVQSGYFESDQWKELEAKGYDKNWTPIYKTQPKFGTGVFEDEKGRKTDLGLVNEFGEFENPSKVNIGGGNAPLPSRTKSKVPSDIKMEDLQFPGDDRFPDYATYVDPQDMDIRYVHKDDVGYQFGTPWHNLLKKQGDERAAAWEKRKAELLEKKRQQEMSQSGQKKG